MTEEKPESKPIWKDEREYDKERKAAKRAGDRDLFIPSIEDADRRRQLEEDDAEWLRFYFPDVFFNPFTDEQHRTIADIERVLSFGLMKCKADERGGGKSSIIKYLLLKYSLQRKIRFPLVLCATNGKAKKATVSIRRRMASRAPTEAELRAIAARGRSTKGMVPNLFASDYPFETTVARVVERNSLRAKNMTGNGGRQIAVEWGSVDGYFILPTWADEEEVGPIFMALSYSSDELQGCNVYDRRPDAVILDDLDSRDSLASEDGIVASKIEEVIDKTVSGLGGQSQRMGQYFICTITSEDAAAAKYSDPKKKPAWDGERVAALKQWPTHIDKWEHYVDLYEKGIHEGDKFARVAHEYYLANREPNVPAEQSMDYGAEISNPYRFDATELEDGSQMEVSALQNCWNFIAKFGLDAFKTERQNDPPEKPDKFEAKVDPYIVSSCAGDYPRRIVDEGAELIVAGIDIRKKECHYSILSESLDHPNLIPDYNAVSHPEVTDETTVEEAEEKILQGLHAIADKWQAEPLTDEHGNPHSIALTIIDAGWTGTGEDPDENNEPKTWQTQPVEVFCRERDPRRWIPAFGTDKYKRQEEKADVIQGDNWYIRKGKGKMRGSNVVIWNVRHWRPLVEELFMLSPNDEGEPDPQRFVLFDPPSGKNLWKNHKRLGEHIRAGAEELAESRSTKRRKKKYRRDHFWDSFAMMLVARSVEKQLRTVVRRRPRKSLSQMAAEARR